MSTSIGFASLPREIRDQIYEEVLVSSEPILMTYRNFPKGKVIEKGLGLLDAISINRQIAQEACEMYFGYNIFYTYSSMHSIYLNSKVDLTGGQWLFPAAWIRDIIAIAMVVKAEEEDVAERFKVLFKCPNLRRVTFKAYTVENEFVITSPHSGLVTQLDGLIYLGRKLKKDLGVELELYLYNFGYYRPRTSDPDNDVAQSPKLIDETENVGWLFDEPDVEVCRKIENDGGTDKEWLMLQMATNWAPIRMGIWPDSSGA